MFLGVLSQGQIVDFGADDLDQQEVNSLLSQVREKIPKENQELHIQQVLIQVTSSLPSTAPVMGGKLSLAFLHFDLML